MLQNIEQPSCGGRGMRQLVTLCSQSGSKDWQILHSVTFLISQLRVPAPVKGGSSYLISQEISISLEISWETQAEVSPDSKSRQVDNKDSPPQQEKIANTVILYWLQHSLLCIYRRPWNQPTSQIAPIPFIGSFIWNSIFLLSEKKRKARKSFSRCWHGPFSIVSIFCFLEYSFLNFQNVVY